MMVKTYYISITIEVTELNYQEAIIDTNLDDTMNVIDIRISKTLGYCTN